MAPQEKEIVQVIHEDDHMQLKALVAKFKPTFTEKADKDLFMAIVKRVAKFVQDGEDRFVRLNDSTLDQYGLSKPVAAESSGSSSHGSGYTPVVDEMLTSDGATLASAALAAAAGLAAALESCGSSSHDIPVVDETLKRRLTEQSDKLDSGYSAIENCGSQAPPHGHKMGSARARLLPLLRALLATLGSSSFFSLFLHFCHFCDSGVAATALGAGASRFHSGRFHSF